MATAKRSALEEAPLALVVEDVTDISARAAGGVLTDQDKAVLAIEREEKIKLIVKEHGVPTAIAKIMCDTGYSKGTCNRIFADNAKRERAQREAAQAATQAKQAKQPSGATA